MTAGDLTTPTPETTEETTQGAPQTEGTESSANDGDEEEGGDDEDDEPARGYFGRDGMSSSERMHIEDAGRGHLLR